MGHHKSNKTRQKNKPGLTNNKETIKHIKLKNSPAGVTKVMFSARNRKKEHKTTQQKKMNTGLKEEDKD